MHHLPKLYGGQEHYKNIDYHYQDI
jgi:hypothetical protein